MTQIDMAARYPRRFELFRLEPLGEPAYYSEEEARARYEQQRGLSVIARADPPGWYIESAPKYAAEAPDHAWFAVTFYTPDKTPLREVKWRRTGDELFCRRSIDVFYPDGDPKWRVPFADVVTVRQEFSTDGVVVVTRESPIDEDMVREVDGAPVDEYRLAVPAFGQWEALLRASAPADTTRFGWDAIDAADEYARQCAAVGMPRGVNPSDGGWRVAAAAPGVAAAIQAVLDGDRPRLGIPLIERGAARILPLMLQADPRLSGRDPWEDRHRVGALNDEIEQACEFFFGRQMSPPSVDLQYRGDDQMAAYVAALRAAGATRAVWWVAGGDGVVLVHTGDELRGDLALAVHVVPVGWVSDRNASPGGERVDVRWSRADVVAAEAGSLDASPPKEQDA